MSDMSGSTAMQEDAPLKIETAVLRVVSNSKVVTLILMFNRSLWKIN